MNSKDKFLVKNMTSSTEHFIGIMPGPPPEVDGNLDEENKIKIGNSVLSVIETPGHTPGSICLYDSKNNILFSGDTLFAQGGTGRTDFSYSDKIQLTSSLKRIFALPGKTRIFPGHGRSSTLRMESNYHNLIRAS